MSLNIGGFFPMESAGSIPNSYKIDYVGDRINGKRICDFGAGVTGFISRALREGYTFTHAYEIDPVYRTKISFDKAKSVSLGKFDNVSKDIQTLQQKLQQTLIDLGKIPEKDLKDDSEFKKLLEGANQKIEETKRLIASILEQQHDISLNQFYTSDLKRFSSLEKLKYNPIDVILLGSIFYASQSPSLLLNVLENLLSPDGEILIFDHIDKPNIGNILGLSGVEGIKILDRTEKGACTISISKTSIPILQEAFR